MTDKIKQIITNKLPKKFHNLKVSCHCELYDFKNSNPMKICDQYKWLGTDKNGYYCPITWKCQRCGRLLDQSIHIEKKDLKEEQNNE